MLKVTIHAEHGLTRLVIEGRLFQDSIPELTRAWLGARDATPDGAIEVDLSDLTYIDRAAMTLLVNMHRQAVHLTGSGTMTRALIHQVAQAARSRDAAP